MNPPKYQMMRAVHWDTDEIRELSTEEIVQKLKDFGVDFKRDSFLRDVQRYYSACDLAEDWRKIYWITAKGYDEDFIWMACIVLWERLAPSVINSEQIDDKMQDGYELSHQGKHNEAGGLWLEVWEHLKGRFTKEMKSIYDAERVFNGMQLLSNWCQDFEDELMTAAEEDPVFHKQRLQYCKEFCGFFPQTGGCIIQNMQSAMEESSRILKTLFQPIPAYPQTRSIFKYLRAFRVHQGRKISKRCCSEGNETSRSRNAGASGNSSEG